MNKVCDNCNLGLKREDCSESEFKERLNKEFNKGLHYLYLLDRNKKEKFCGAGNKEYIMELINDYIIAYDVYGEESISFKIKRGL